jgi:hypothetical protein
MSRKFHRVRAARVKLADRLAAERRAGAKRPNAGEVIAKLGDHLARRRAAGSYQQADFAAEGAQLNNMAPSIDVGGVSGVRVLQQGIDTLVLNIYGQLRDDVAECLAAAKQDAQAADLGEALSPLPPFDGVVPLMQASGVAYYEYHLRSPDLTVIIAKPGGRSSRPVAVLTLRAETLWRLGGGGLVAAKKAAYWLTSQFEAGYRVQVRAVHLATDYQGRVIAYSDIENAIKRAPYQIHGGDLGGDSLATRHARNGGLESLSAGKSNNLRLNLYDKTLEAPKKGKLWVFDLWRGCVGYAEGEPVWRVEFQFGREFLHARGIETLDDLVPQLSALWRYGMAWFSFRTPNPADTNRSRWAIAPWWLTLSQWGVAGGGGIPKVKVVRPRLDRLATGLAGYLTSFMAVADLDSADAAINHALRIAADGDMAKMDLRLGAKRLRYAGFTMASA